MHAIAGTAPERRPGATAALALVLTLACAWLTAPPLPSAAEVPAAAVEAGEDGPELHRLSGPDRWATAVAISREAYPDGAPVVYLARGVDPLVDALAGAALPDGPILLVPGCGDLPGAVVSEIDRLDPGAVTALGGSAAICDAVLDAAAAGRSRGRIAGSDRYETAAMIARRAFTGGAGTVYLARGEDPVVDALAGASLRDGPVLLVPPCGPVPGGVSEALAALDPDRVTALGGQGAICEATLEEAAAGRAHGRHVGASRYETAVAIAGAAYPDGADRVYVARGTEPFVDALAGGSLRDGPVLLLPACGSAPPAVRAEIERAAPSELVALGGASALCDQVLRSAAGLADSASLICRQAWEARAPAGAGSPHRITGLMIHHSAVTLADNRAAPQHLRSFQDSHQHSGFVDIAYHVGVDRNGNLYELRSPGIAGETYTDYDPSGWLLVLALGNFDEQEPTAAQLEGMARVLAWGAGTYGVDPAEVAGHRDAAATRCPGEALYRELESGRLSARVQDLLAGGGVDLRDLCGEAGAARVREIEAGTR